MAIQRKATEKPPTRWPTWFGKKGGTANAADAVDAANTSDTANTANTAESADAVNAATSARTTPLVAVEPPAQPKTQVREQQPEQERQLEEEWQPEAQARERLPEMHDEESQSTINSEEHPATTQYLEQETSRGFPSPQQSRESCWETATKALQNDRPDDYKKLEQIECTDKSIDDPTKLLKLAEVKMESGQLVFGRFESVIRYILQFKDTAAAVANFDPSKFVPVALRGVCVILEACLGECSLSREVLRDLNTITHNLSHWAEVEKLYLGTTKNDSNKFNPLQLKLIKFYTAILNLEIVLVSWVSAGRFGKTATQSNMAVKWRDLVNNINADHKACESTFAYCRLNIDELGKIKMWISNFRPEDAHDDALKRTGVDEKYRTCGQWFLDTWQFKAWSSAGDTPGQNILWIRGTTGTGKSTLFTRVVQWHLDRASLYPNHRFAYFYCSRGKDLKTYHSYESVLRALLRQAAYDPVKGEVVASVLNAYQNAGGSSGDLRPLTLDECKTLLRGILEPEAKLKLRIMVDALDECDKPKELLSALRDASLDNPGALKLLVSSRHEVCVTEKLPSAVTINLNAEATNIDMIRYITKEVLGREKDDRLLRGHYVNLEQRLIEILCERSGGMFRWVQLQLSAFLNPRTPYRLAESVEQALKKLDTGSVADENELWVAYSDIFERNAGQDDIERGCARLIYQLFFGVGSLSLGIIEKAVAFGMDVPSIDHMVIRQLTQDFLVPTPGGLRLEFAHVSVKDYLLQAHPSEYADKNCAAQLARMCLKYVSSQDVATVEAELDLDEFLDYSFDAWGFHASKLTKEERQKIGLSSELIDWLVEGSGSLKFKQWVSIARKHASYDNLTPSDSDSPIFAACAFNLVEVLELLADRDLCLGSRNMFGNTPLSLAATCGYEASILVLLARGADVNLQEKGGLSPLLCAVRGGHGAVVELLLEEGADVNLRDVHGHSPWDWATWYGEEAVAKLLLEKGANVTL